MAGKGQSCIGDHGRHWLVAVQGIKGPAVHGWWFFLTFPSVPAQNWGLRKTPVGSFVHSVVPCPLDWQSALVASRTSPPKSIGDAVENTLKTRNTGLQGGQLRHWGLR